MRCVAFSAPANCVGDACMMWVETSVIDVETGKEVADPAGKDVIRFGRCGLHG